jgi:uncharacterized protein (UPF0335 family)
MSIEKLVIEALFESIEAREVEKKEIADDIKASIEAFASNNELNKKSVSKAYKEWKECRKDKESFIATDWESDRIFTTLFPEFATGNEQ